MSNIDSKPKSGKKKQKGLEKDRVDGMTRMERGILNLTGHTVQDDRKKRKIIHDEVEESDKKRAKSEKVEEKLVQDSIGGGKKVGKPEMTLHKVKLSKNAKDMLKARLSAQKSVSPVGESKERKERVAGEAVVKMHNVEKKQSNGKSRETVDEKKKSKGGSKDTKESMSNQSSLPVKLQGAQFRFINEKLYTTPSQEAVALMKRDPSAYEAYHNGFRKQVEKWPVNPVDVYIDQLQKQIKTGKLIKVADLGCGDAKIAATFDKSGRLGKSIEIHSFDLVSGNKYVKACDISKLPLGNDSMDVAIFSLSLMGLNWSSFVKEATRVLKKGGHLKIAEVVSRFDNVDNFVTSLESVGLKLKSKDMTNKMFVFFEFVKTGEKSREGKGKEVVLNPCVYKKR